MPKLWSETIETHRNAVREATLDTTAALVAERGLRSVTMSQIAEQTGIGRATLYKYFPDVESILRAWHKRQIAEHVDRLSELAQRPGNVDGRLSAVLAAYAEIQYEHRTTGDLAGALHVGEHVAHARDHLAAFLGDLLAEAARSGRVRDDVAPNELASFCLNALAAATSAPSKAAVHRLVAVTLAGLRPDRR